VKILFVQKVKALAGSEKYFLQLIPALQKKDIDVEFACVCNTADHDNAKLFIDACRAKGLTLHVLEVNSDKAVFKTLRFIRGIIRQGNFDLVHTHLIHADFWLALLKKSGKLKIPLASTKHGYDEQYLAKHGFDATQVRKNLYYQMCRFSEKQVTRSFAVSQGLMRFFIETGISPAEKIESIHHGFDLPSLAKEDPKNYRWSEHQVLLLGRVIPFKGHHHVIEALPVIVASIPLVKLVIAGHGDKDYIEKLKMRIRELNLDEHVVFTGYTIKAHQFMLHSDVMVIPSVAEGFGLVFLEALNAKIPVVGFDVPATNEIISHNKSGVLVKPYDTQLLGQAIVSLLSDREKAARFTAAGYQELVDYFTLDRMVEQTRTFYGSCIAYHNNSGRAR
jgi:glycosyltransferase involved in cell wall biosynthesis